MFHSQVRVVTAGQIALPPSTNDQQISRFVADDRRDTLSELLSGDPKLRDCAQRLEEAELDAELVSALSLADLRELLPGAPAAHCLLLRHRLSEGSTSLRPVIPDAPAWKWQARMVANAVRDGNLKDQATMKHEFDLIVGSLFLSFAIGPVLSPPTACADGRACPGMLAADMLCWVSLTITLLLCVVVSWSMAAIEQCVSSASMARWIHDNWRFFNLGGGLMVTSFTFLPVALSTRSVILLRNNPSYPAWLVWVVVATLSAGGIILQYVWWVIICCRTFTISSPCDFVAFNLGVLGFRMPKRQLENATEQKPVPYME
jgi:hypothetical protein